MTNIKDKVYDIPNGFAPYKIKRNIKDTNKKVELAERSKYYIMKNICELAGVNYQTYKNSVANGYAKLSGEKVDALLKTMNRI